MAQMFQVYNWIFYVEFENSCEECVINNIWTTHYLSLIKYQLWAFISAYLVNVYEKTFATWQEYPVTEAVVHKCSWKQVFSQIW